MKTKVIAVLSTVAVLHLVVGGMFLTSGCAPEEPPMPPGVYVPPPTAPKTGRSNHNNPLFDKEIPAVQKASRSNHNNPLIEKEDPAAKITPELKNEPAVPKTDLEDFKPADLKPESDQTVAPGKKDTLLTGDSAQYTVVKGDSLWKIAKMHSISVAELAAYNNMAPTAGVKVGQKLLIPPGAKAVKAVPAVKADTKPAKKAEKAAKKAAPAAKKAEKAAVAADGIYVVKSGDSFSKIASKHHMKVSELEAANPGVSSNRLQIGQKLNIKAGAGAVAPAVAKKAEKNTEKSAPAAKPAAADSEGMLLEDIPNPDAPAKTAESKDVNPVASADAVKTVTEGATAASTDDKVVNSADGSSVKVGADTTVEAIAKKYGHQVDELKIMNPALPADGKVKAGTVVVLP